MPLVQRYGLPRQELKPLPGVRKTAAETDESEGVGIEDAKARGALAFAGFGQSLAQAGGQGLAVASAMAKEERDNANQVAIMKADTQTQQWINKRLNDPTNGALAQHGENSFGLPESVMGEFDTVTGDIENTLTTPEQKLAYDKLKAQHKVSLDATLRRHVFGEQQKYQGDIIQATRASAVQTAGLNAGDDRMIAIALDKATSATDQAAKMFGWSPEVTAQEHAKDATAIHTTVIDSLIDGKQYSQARAYWTANQDDVTDPKARQHITNALETAGTEAEAQAESDRILANPAFDTLTKQRAEAKKIARPEVRDSVMRRLSEEYATNERLENKNQEDTLNRAYSRIDAGGSVDGLSSVDKQTIATHLPALREYEKRRKEGLQPETNLDAWYQMQRMATSDDQGQRDAFVSTNLLTLRHLFNDHDIRQLMEAQGQMRAGDMKAGQKVFDGFMTRDQIWKDTIAPLGIDEKSQAAADLHNRIDSAVLEWERRSGKKADNDAIRAITNDQIESVILTPGSYFLGILPFGGPFKDVTKPVRQLTFNDIPAADRDAILAALRAENQLADPKNPAVQDRVITTYLQRKRQRGETTKKQP